MNTPAWSPGLPLPMVVQLAWVPVVVVLFRWLGRRNTTLVALIGGELFLPDVEGGYSLPLGLLTFRLDRGAAEGLALLLAILVWDARTLVRFRPTRWDLPFLAFVAWMACLGMGAEGSAYFTRRMAWWVVAYLAARLYFSDLEGAVRAAVGIVVGTLALAPVVFLESALGPSWFLKGRVYGLPFANVEMLGRLGGWRPEGFFFNGVELSAWVCTASALSVWLWLGDVWRPRRGPAWWPSLVLLLAAAATRGVYGYLAGLAGLAALAVTLGFRTRTALVALALVAPVYIGLRTTGLWDARALVALGGQRGGTVAIRLETEGQVVRQVFDQAPLLGFSRPLGLANWPVERVAAVPHVDSFWAYLLWTGGLLALVLYYVSLFLLPTATALRRPARRPSRVEAGSPVWGLAMYLLVWMAYSAQNWTYFVSVPLAAGVLTGLAATGRGADRWTGRRPMVRHGSARRRPWTGWGGGRAPDTVDAAGLAPATAAAAFSCLIYVFYAAGRGGPESGTVDLARLVGGLGSAPLFAAAGWLGSWAGAERRLTFGRLAVLAAAFGALGTSFNLALHPTTRPVLLADVLQCLALCTLIVAAWRRWVGGPPIADAALMVLPLAVQMVLRPAALLPVFPGSHYLYEASAVRDLRVVYAVCPWLALSALGAWAQRERAATALAAAGLFLAGAALTAWSEALPVKQPMNLSYALLALGVASAALAAGRATAGARAAAGARGSAARGIDWLGRHWLVFFYFHFAVSAALAALAPGLPAWAGWLAQGGLTLAATWLAVTAARPLARPFLGPAPWIALLVVVLAVGAWPSVGRTVVLAVAGGAGVLFATRTGELAALCLGRSPGGTASASASARPRGRAPAAELVDTPRAAALRVTVALALLAAPEVVGWLMPAPSGVDADQHPSRPPAGPGRLPDTSR